MHRLPSRTGRASTCRCAASRPFFIIIAIAFYAWFLTHYGPHQVIGYVRMAGWGLAVTISLEALSRIANTLGWRVTIEDYPPALRFIELFAARIGGEAVDYVTPSAQLGGQFVMAVDVREKLRMPVGLATVVVASLAEAIGQIVFMSVALVISLRLIPVSANILLVDSRRVCAGGGAGGRLLLRADEAAVSRICGVPRPSSTSRESTLRKSASPPRRPMRS